MAYHAFYTDRELELIVSRITDSIESQREAVKATDLLILFQWEQLLVVDRLGEAGSVRYGRERPVLVLDGDCDSRRR